MTRLNTEDFLELRDILNKANVPDYERGDFVLSVGEDETPDALCKVYVLTDKNTEISYVVHTEWIEYNA
jgi:hypothetical protein